MKIIPKDFRIRGTTESVDGTNAFLIDSTDDKEEAIKLSKAYRNLLSLNEWKDIWVEDKDKNKIT